MYKKPQVFDNFEYLALYEGTYSEHNTYDNSGNFTREYKAFKGFKTKQEMIDWVLEEKQKNYNRKDFTIVSCKYVPIKIEVNIDG